jgi:hypothetical protein
MVWGAEWPNIPTGCPSRSHHHFQPDVLPVWFVLFSFFFQHALIGHADFVDQSLPLRLAVAQETYRTA